MEITHQCIQCREIKNAAEFETWFTDNKPSLVCKACRKKINDRNYVLQKAKPDYKEVASWRSSVRRELLKNGSHTEKDWEILKEKFYFTCPSCGRNESDIKLVKDHIKPLAKGGTNDIGNIQPLCSECNASKRAKYKRYPIPR